MKSRQSDSTDDLTFSQRYGYAPLPEPMRLEEISAGLRREIWNAIRELILRNTLAPPFFEEKEKRFIERVLGRVLEKAEHEIDVSYENALNQFGEVTQNGPFHVVLELVETIANDGPHAENFVNRVSESFKRHAAAYRLDTSQRPYRFFPETSKEQGKAVRQAIETLRESGMKGADTHLRQAAEHIKAGKYGDSIADSIHAVESVAKKIDQRANKTLGSALNSLEKTGLLKHSALKEAFKKLYGYTSDEQGIRHALLEKSSPDVGLDEAMFMFGACASFAAYLVSKHRQSKQQNESSQ